MPQAAYVYVPIPSRENLETGLVNGVWGWKAETLDRAGSRAVVASLADGDFLILGHGGTNPRVPSDGWRHESLQRVVVAQVTERLYTSTAEVWLDDVYPERVGLEILGDYREVTGIAPAAMEALRMSANKQGAAVRGPASEALIELAAIDLVDDVPSANTLPEAETDVMRSVLVRAEQHRLRKLKFGDAVEIDCAICRRRLPARIVHAAHIKRRKDAGYAERMDLANIMGACTLGCDALFEFGFIYVDEDGLIRIRPNAPQVLAEAASGLEGERCDAFCRASEVYFEYQRTEIAKVR
jgi:hypothetical protein